MALIRGKLQIHSVSKGTHISSRCVSLFLNTISVFLHWFGHHAFIMISLWKASTWLACNFPSETVLWIHVAHRFYCSLGRSTLSFATPQGNPLASGKDGQGLKVPARKGREWKVTHATFTKETEGYIPSDAERLQSFPEPF